MKELPFIAKNDPDGTVNNKVYEYAIPNNPLSNILFPEAVCKE